MNASQALSIIAAIEQAARAGFTITIGPTLVNPGRILVQIAPTVVHRRQSHGPREEVHRRQGLGARCTRQRSRCHDA